MRPGEIGEWMGKKESNNSGNPVCPYLGFMRKYSKMSQHIPDKQLFLYFVTRHMSAMLASTLSQCWIVWALRLTDLDPLCFLIFP